MFEYSSLEFYIDNPVLVKILSKYQSFFEERGFAFIESEETGNVVIECFDDEASFINVPTSLKTAARDFVKYNRFDFFEDNDAMCDDLLREIAAHDKEINDTYYRLEISWASSGEEPDVVHYTVLKYEDGQESYEEYDEDI